MPPVILIMISRVLICSLALVAFSGCGSNVGTFEGRVTLDGKPAVNAEVEFRSEVDKRVRISAVALENGTYQVDYGAWDGLPEGPCRITVTHYLLRDGSPLPEGEEGYALRDTDKVVKRQVVFHEEIDSGTNKIDLEINEGEPVKED